MTLRALSYSLLCCLSALSLLAQTPPAKPSGTAPQASAQAVALKNGKLLTITRGVIENGTLVMQDGKITAAGAAASVSIPRGAKVIDVTGMTVYPGLIDSETHIGLLEIDLDRATNDTVETSDEIMPHMHVYDAF